jgi:ABC-type dipeptide/oligopeptide/nickel transport system ATPase subunit
LVDLVRQIVQLIVVEGQDLRSVKDGTGMQANHVYLQRLNAAEFWRERLQTVLVQVEFDERRELSCSGRERTRIGLTSLIFRALRSRPKFTRYIKGKAGTTTTTTTT